jgi:hypothetical protein
MSESLITSGQVTLNTQLSLSSGILSNISNIAFNPLITLALSSGGANTSVGFANQIFAASIAVAQGSPASWNLYTMAISTVAGGAAPNDGVGQAYTMAKLKLLIIQNLGYSASSPVETDLLDIIGTGSSTALTSLLIGNAATCGLILPGPVNAAAVTAGQAPALIVFNPGVTSYAVASGAGANTLVLSSSATGRTCNLNIVAVGSIS